MEAWCAGILFAQAQSQSQSAQRETKTETTTTTTTTTSTTDATMAGAASCGPLPPVPQVSPGTPSAQAPANTLQVLHWWTSASERKAADLLAALWKEDRNLADLAVLPAKVVGERDAAFRIDPFGVLTSVYAERVGLVEFARHVHACAPLVSVSGTHVH